MTSNSHRAFAQEGLAQLGGDQHVDDAFGGVAVAVGVVHAGKRGAERVGACALDCREDAVDGRRAAVLAANCIADLSRACAGGSDG